MTSNARSRPDHRLLGIYLNDHLAGASAGLALARRVVGSHQGSPAEPDLADLAREVEADRATLIAIMARLRIRRDPVKATIAVVGERAGRLKLNGSLIRRSPLSQLVELEMMSLGVEGKQAGWRSLRELADVVDGLDARELDELIDRAQQQRGLLERLRTETATHAFTR